MDTWSNIIKVTIIIENTFRVGSRIAYKTNSDLPIATVGTGKNSKRPYLPPSSLKGMVRTACQKAISISKKEDFEEAYIRLFGSEPSKKKLSKEGKLRFYETHETEEKLTKLGTDAIMNRNGIRIDKVVGSVAYQSLFEFDFIDFGKHTNLSFSIYPVFPIKEDEAAVLIAGLRLLKYDTIGGFGSRGFGIIQDVEITPDEFVNFAEKALGGYFE